MNTKTAYLYDSETKQYIDTIPCFEDPIRENLFSLPANSTFTKPLKNKEKNIQVFEDEKWVYIENHVGEIYYS